MSRISCPAPPAGATLLNDAFGRAQLEDQTPASKKFGEEIAPALAVGFLLFLLTFLVR